MNNLSFSPYLFLRTPALSYNENTALDKLIKTHFFQLAIFFASESLYLELKRSNFNYNDLEKKTQFSIQKYYNRMCYRPTPFGLFSAFTSLNWHDGKVADEGINLLDDNNVFISADFQLLVNIVRTAEAEAQETISQIKYYTNNSIYSIKSEKRYLTNSHDQKSKKNIFLVASFKSNRLLNQLLSFCRPGKTKTDLLNWLNNVVEDQDEVTDYVEELIQAGLLIAELRPNMSGQKYLDRLAKISSGLENEFSRNILNLKSICDANKNVENIDLRILTCNQLFNASGKKLKSPFYVGFEKYTQATLTSKYQENIKDALYCLNKLTPDTRSKSLETFKNQFRARFENQEVPLLLALDREAGVGYEGLESNLFTSSVLDGIQLDLQSNNVNFNWTAAHELFLSKLAKAKNCESIYLSDNDINKIQLTSELKIPPTFSVMFRVFNDKIWIEQAGGCTATALLGRFTQFSEVVHAETCKLDEQERELNKDIIFAEISCFNDEHSANINLNAGIRVYEIPIGVHSTLNRANIINLSDITISVIEDQIILRTKRLNKVIIPRLSSAYNYNRSDLSIYRFLCDLQFQGLKYNYNLDLKSLLPGLSFYPRVEYKSCILFPATWILTGDEIAELYDASNIRDSLKVVLQKMQITRFFAFTEGDNYLVFDCNDLKSLNLLLDVLKNKNTATLQEVFFDQLGTVNDTLGQSLVNQFIASIVNNNPTYSTKLVEAVAKNNTTKRIYLPGDEWVYFKVYCHPSFANNVLIKHVKKIIAGLKKLTVLKGWYFIRYNDPDNHLRIRVQINKKDIAEVINWFEKRFRNQVQIGSVNNLMVDTYKREIERYGARTIVYAEKIFEASSDMVLNYLQNIFLKLTDYSELHFAIITIDMLLESFYAFSSDRIALLKLIHENMKHEFEDNKQVKIQLDNKYRECSPFMNNMAGHKQNIVQIIGKKEVNYHIKCVETLKINIKYSVHQLNKLVADIMHMHLNRIFYEKQRKQEFVIYYLLNKFYLSQQARREKSQSMFTTAPNSLGINYAKKSILK